MICVICERHVAKLVEYKGSWICKSCKDMLTWEEGETRKRKDTGRNRIYRFFTKTEARAVFHNSLILIILMIPPAVSGLIFSVFKQFVLSGNYFLLFGFLYFIPLMGFLAAQAWTPKSAIYISVGQAMLAFGQAAAGSYYGYAAGLYHVLIAVFAYREIRLLR